MKPYPLGSRCLAVELLLGACLLFAGEAAAQLRALPPSSYSGGSDVLPFLIGTGVLLAVLVVLFALVILPFVARGCGLKEGDEGRRAALAIPLSIAVLCFAWKPLHLTTACVWVTVGFFALVVVAIVVGIGTAVFRHPVEALLIGGSAIATTYFNMTTAWGFWLSLLAGVGVTVAVTLVGAAICDLAIFVGKRVKRS